MLRTKSLTIAVEKLENNLYAVRAIADEVFLPVSDWRNMLFQRHRESYYGAFLEVKNEAVHLDSWQLTTLFAHEKFNPFIEWDWDELAELCLTAAPSLYEAITEKDWLPDFKALEFGEFRWQLPKRVMEEFDISFWERRLGEETVQEFVGDWFHQALNGHLNQNREMKQFLGHKLDLLQKQSFPQGMLSAFFDEDTWLEWIGLKESDVPFTIGLRLDEPEFSAAVEESFDKLEAHEPSRSDPSDWTLELFLRDRKNPEKMVEVAALPTKWRKYMDAIQETEARWVRIFPWLRGISSLQGGDDFGEREGLKHVLSEEEAWMFLTEASETLLNLGVEILLPAWWEAMRNANLKVKARVKGSASSHRPSFVGLQAMLDFDWRFSMNGVDLSEDEFQQLVSEKRRLVYIRGRWVKLDPAFIRQIQTLMKQAEKEGLHVRDLIEQEMIGEEEEDQLENPKAFAKIQIELNRQWKTMIHQLSELKELPEVPVPETLKAELRPYQQTGMNWLLFLRKYGFGAVLADDMGLGKTIQLISYLLSVKEKEPTAGPALIVCPTSVLGNWQKELERFAPSLNVYLHYGSGRLKEEAFKEKAEASDIVLTSYGLTHLDESDFESLTWSVIAIDEAQNIKNAQTKQSRAVRKLKGLHHIALTGTPMENRLAELWSIFDFTNHGYLGSLGQFQKRFIVPIEKDDEKQKIRELQGLIRPFLLRRTKRDEEVALNLPDKLEQKEYCPLTAEQASLYEQLISDTFAQIESLSGIARKGLVLQMLGRLKQLCNHPALYLKEKPVVDILDRSTKMEKLIEIIENVLEREESCLIFTQYIEMGEMIRELLKKKYKLDVPFLNGSVPKAQRDDMISRFQDRKFPVFLLSLKAGGTGLNLTAANHVVHYDRWWNPAVENQATDRAYRIGQERFVHVHKMISTGTLEEKIDAMLEKKQFLNDQVIQSENWITELSTEDLRELVYLS
ncbi:DEAD/DEAH box helicase [Neobacillus sp. D3-1R]|uniref:DEAD/DEAH box helicase n=1 Tax=Neobacillus sp. D3-1R TaxID=3445778 RepID=UPI003FA030F3